MGAAVERVPPVLRTTTAQGWRGERNVMNNDLAVIEQDICTVDDTKPAEVVLAVYDRWQAFAARVKEIDALAKQVVTEWVEKNGPLDAGQVVYWLAHEKKTECVDVVAAVNALLDVEGGDVSATCRNYFASQPLKHGAARNVLPPDVFEMCFRTTVKDKLESGETLPKRLVKVDKAFLKG